MEELSIIKAPNRDKEAKLISKKQEETNKITHLLLHQINKKEPISLPVLHLSRIKRRETSLTFSLKKKMESSSIENQGNTANFNIIVE